MYRSLFGETHPNTAAAKATLGRVRLGLGDAVAAERIHRSVLSTRMSVLGRDPHPALTDALGDLGRAVAAQGRFDEAETLYLDARAMYEESVGPDHPEVRALSERLADLFAVWGRDREGREGADR